MKMNYRFTEDFCMEEVSFEGLSGQEFAGSLKEALAFLKIEDPVVGLREDLKKGRYKDEELEPVLKAVKQISSLWHSPEMNILMLLAAALERISMLQAELERIR